MLSFSFCLRENFLLFRCTTSLEIDSKASKTSEASEIFSFFLEGIPSLPLYLKFWDAHFPGRLFLTLDHGGAWAHNSSLPSTSVLLTVLLFFFSEYSFLFCFVFKADETSWTISSYFPRNKDWPKGGSVRRETYTESHFSASAKESADLVEGPWDLEPGLQEAAQLYVHINHAASLVPGRVGFL